MTYYMNNFENQQDIENEFGLEAGSLDDCDILLADYTHECYSGSAFVLYRQDGKLYEVHGSHCSCYGLETQFDPELTSVEALEHYLKEGEYSYKEYAEQLQDIITRLKKGTGMKKVVFYEATDGTRFENEQDCREYEQQYDIVQAILECINGVNDRTAWMIAKVMQERFTIKEKN